MKIISFLSCICAVFLSLPALAADLSIYAGAYPFEEINGYAFFENPVVTSAVDTAAGGGISEWLADLGVGVPIERQDDGLIAIVCEQHNCSGNNGAVALTAAGKFIAACLYSEDGDHGAEPGKLRWISPRFDKAIANADNHGCPSDASEFLDAYARILK